MLKVKVKVKSSETISERGRCSSFSFASTLLICFVLLHSFVMMIMAMIVIINNEL